MDKSDEYNEIREELYKVEANLAKEIDDWYLKTREKLKNKRPHWTGGMKEKLKCTIYQRLEQLATAVHITKEGCKKDFDTLEGYVKHIHERPIKKD